MISVYFSQTITHTPAQTFNGYGERVAGTVTSRSCRFQQAMRMVRTPQGEEVLSDAQVCLAPGTSVSVGDRFTYGGQTYEALTVKSGQGLDSETHVLVYLGATNVGP